MHSCITRLARLSLPVILLLPIACGSGGSSDNSSTDPGPYRLTYSLDASFQAVHGNQPIRIAVVRVTDGVVVAQGSGTVSATRNPSFTFTANDVLDRGIGYEVHYWIDSNIGGGNLGVCDPKEIDHQWSFEILRATNNVDFTTSYNPALTEDICSTFI